MGTGSGHVLWLVVNIFIFIFRVDDGREAGAPVALPLAMASVFDHIPRFKCPPDQIKIGGKCFKVSRT